MKWAFEIAFGHILFTGWLVTVWLAFEVAGTMDSLPDFLMALGLYWSIPSGVILLAFLIPPRGPRV